MRLLFVALLSLVEGIASFSRKGHSSVGEVSNVVYDPVDNIIWFQYDDGFVAVDWSSEMKQRIFASPTWMTDRPRQQLGSYVGRNENFQPMFEEGTDNVYFMGKVVAHSRIAQVDNFGIYVNDPEQGYIPQMDVTPDTFPFISEYGKKTIRALLLMYQAPKKDSLALSTYQIIPSHVWFKLVSWVYAAQHS